MNFLLSFRVSRRRIEESVLFGVTDPSTPRFQRSAQDDRDRKNTLRMTEEGRGCGKVAGKENFKSMEKVWRLG